MTGNLIYRDAMSIDPLLVLALLSLDVVIAEWLGRRTLLRHFGPALLVILLAALQVNLGLWPVCWCLAMEPLFEFPKQPQ